ncbi:hypothetical protein ABHN11_31295 [Brevibacillus centrosporus]|jgi:hypothetical protein|uniref:hypothetical protein n=1 Tax=Brevibacillus centrosporus TaxID=54910 RepID=UPI003985D3A4
MPQEKDKEKELSDVPGEEEQRKEELEQSEDELREDEKSFASKNEEAAKDLRKSLEEIELQDFGDPSAMDAVQSGSSSSSSIGYSGEEPNSELNRLDQHNEEAHHAIQANSTPEKKSWNWEKWTAIGGFATALFTATTLIPASVAFLYTVIRDAMNDEEVGPSQFPSDAYEKIRKMVRQWINEPDAQYWNDLANYAEKGDPPLTIADQILFMDYTIDLFPGDEWIWDSRQDVVDFVNQLITVYNSNANKTSEMYRAVTTWTYHDRPFTRPVAATLLRYALTKIYVNY